jgi:general L-amino acid transport system substrate-binding protein
MQAAALLLAVVMSAGLAWSQPTARLDQVRARGNVGCGVEPRVPGFSEADAAGRYSGFDVDICRAVAAAVFGAADRVSFIQVGTVDEFRRNPRIDVVSRMLTWEVRRERPLGLLFGPITFYDGQSFLVPRALGITTPKAAGALTICVAGGTVFEVYANEFLGAYRKVVLESAHAYREIADALMSGQCQAHTGDVSDLAAVRSLLRSPQAYDILPDYISKEPLAPLVRDDDAQWFNIVRWTVFALISAEELGVTSANVDRLRSTASPLEVQRLLGVVPGNGAALGLPEDWARNVIKAVGNYGEMYERNLGAGSRIKLDRGLNRLWKDGGLMYAPPLR